jgi:predicted mannosyl-3-phosphoglycerate phosphatase (HAD superfamily)
MLGGFKTYDDIDDQEFAKVLGLPEITVETLFKEHSEKDDFINSIMNE